MTSGYRMVAQHRPAELFRADLISAMKLPDSVPMESGSFLTIKDPWRTEWEVGVQVCVSPDQILEPNTRPIDDPPERQKDFRMPPTWCTEENTDQECVQYDLDDLDLNWLEAVNQKRKFRALAGSSGLTEESLREAILTLETMCQQNMAHAVTTEQTLGIEYDEHTMCDVCRDHESEEANDILFCDSCNICVHQACYGVQSIPRGDWMCKACSADGYDPTCVLCPNPGGALKRVRPGNSSWAHLNCALWIPEVRVGNVEKMEPITNVEAVPISRWNLVCCVCRKKQGACIQCSHPSCVTAYHVTCAFQHGLEMKARLELISNGVIHESYCPKHTVLRKSPSKLQSPRKNDMNKSTQLLQVQEEFYKYTSPQDLRDELKLSSKLSTLIYNYWKLKRRSFHNRPLLSYLPIETAIDSIRAELTLGSQYGLSSDQTFGKIVHLRQNLEKARNLVYMVQRREKLKKQLLRSEVEAFEMESQLLEEELEEEMEAEAEAEQCVRQTRSMTQEMDKETTGTAPPAPPTCNHVSHPPTMNGPTNGSNSSPETSKESSPVPHRNLRKKDFPKLIAFDENHLLRKSIRRRFSDSIVMDDSLTVTGGGNGLLGDVPALNLRYRPYSVCKSTKL